MGLSEGFCVGVVGAGYVGIVTGVCLAHIGYWVVCVDREADRIADLKEGRKPLYERGLEEMVESASAKASCASRRSFQRP